jgi:type II secretion system protein G
MRTIFPVKVRSGFTLIELLIVVAIIAILAAIAVPNFLEAQVRAKVARVKSDMRTVATGLEAYRVDANTYPPTPFCGPGAGVLTVVPTRLSTPISYLTTANFSDPFIDANFPDFTGLNSAGNRFTYAGDNEPEGFDPAAGRRYYYQLLTDPRRSSPNFRLRAEVLGAWEMASIGPNKTRDFVEPQVAPFYMELYDPTNGTVSAGNIIRTQAFSEGSRGR